MITNIVIIIIIIIIIIVIIITIFIVIIKMCLFIHLFIYRGMLRAQRNIWRQNLRRFLTAYCCWLFSQKPCLFQESIYWLLLVFIPLCSHVFSFLFSNLYQKTFTFFNLLIKLQKTRRRKSYISVSYKNSKTQ